MSKLIYGRNQQVQFFSEEEKKEAIDYILNNPENVDFNIHEHNEQQGAWAPEDRIHFKSEEGVPYCLKRQMTAGRGDMYGRINCKEFCEEIREIAKKLGK